MTFWKMQTLETGKRSVVARGGGGVVGVGVRGKGISSKSTEDLGGSENTLYGTTMADTCH